jgi:predicted DsbA family dithiol-disulfide isomerase
MERVVLFEAWSDYLCPWCWNASRRLRSLADEFDGQIEIVWKSYLLRPVSRGARDIDRFRRYAQGWQVPGADTDAGPFSAWPSDATPPTYSVPAHRVAKAAACLGPEAFGVIHEGLMRAYFAESRDISDFDVLRELWMRAGLPASAFEVARADWVGQAIARDHEEARTLGATGVPAIRRIDNDVVIVGAHPAELYRRWVERSLERGEGLVDRSRAD